MSSLHCACFSGLIRLPEFAPGIRTCVALLLAAGADPHDAWIDPAFPDEPLSALYAAAGRNHDVELARMLLDAGAEPNDNVYGTLSFASIAETMPDGDWLGCARVLIDSGAPIPDEHYAFSDDAEAYFEELRSAAA